MGSRIVYALQYRSFFIEVSSGSIGVLATVVINTMPRIEVLMFVITILVFVYFLNKLTVISQRMEMIIAKRTKLLKKKTQRLHYLANFDELTGLPNRRNFNKNLQKLNAKGDMFYLAFIDLDYFKKINDTYSHQTGDLVLEKIGEVFADFTSPQVRIYRFGGEEFVSSITKLERKEVIKMCRQIKDAIEMINWSFIDENISTTISIGVAKYTQNMEISILNKADENLYLAKDSGRNTIIYR